MTTIDTTLADIVSTNPNAARVLDRLGLDFCCNGDRPLVDACRHAGIEPSAVLAALEAAGRGGDTAWTSLSAVELADHIVSTHHAYLREELPLLEALAIKVAHVHGARHPELDRVERLVHELRHDLEPHLDKEERVLFPALRALASGRTDFPFGTIANPIRVMLGEHDRAGELLAELRATTSGYTVPDDGCASYRALYERLEAIEADTHLHVHKENHALFPKALEMEAPS